MVGVVYRDNTPIDNLPEKTTDLVAEAPVCLATGGKDNDFYIIYFQHVPETLAREIAAIHNSPRLDALLEQVMTVQNLHEIDLNT